MTMEGASISKNSEHTGKKLMILKNKVIEKESDLQLCAPNEELRDEWAKGSLFRSERLHYITPHHFFPPSVRFIFGKNSDRRLLLGFEMLLPGLSSY